MRDLADAYDLGEVGSATTVARPRSPSYAPSAAAVRRVAAAHRARGWSSDPRPELSGSLSLFLPGAGQFLCRRITLGLFFLSSLGFLAAASWAALSTFDRLAPTLALLEIPISVPLGMLACAYLMAAGLHVFAVLDASRPEDSTEAMVPHPVIPGVASALVPGWGQLLNGDRLRASLFLVALWIVAGIWFAGSSSATAFLNAHVPAVTGWEQTLRAPFFAWTARWTLPVLVWTVAVYDATSSAAARYR